MKIKISLVMLALCLALSVIPLSGCSFAPKPSPYTVTRITIDSVADVEFYVDPNNKVIAATPMNTEALIVMNGESFLDLKPEKAVALFLEVAVAHGIFSEDAKDGYTVKLSVSGSDEYADYLKEELTLKIERHLNKLGVKGETEEAKPATYEELREMIEDSGYYNSDELENMRNEEYLSALCIYRIASAAFPTVAVKDTYSYARNRAAAVEKRKAYVETIKALGDGFKTDYENYAAAFAAYSESAELLEDLRYKAFVSPDSEYQKAFAAVIDGAKNAMLTKDTKAYEEALSVFAVAEENAKKSLWDAMESFYAAEEAIETLEDGFVKDIKSAIRKGALDLQNKVETMRLGYKDVYAEEHKDDIGAINSVLAKAKQELAGK